MRTKRRMTSSRRPAAAGRGVRSALSSIYKRMSLAGKAGLARIKSLRNRTGVDHLAMDAEDFAYIEKEAHDILSAIARLRARDAGEYPMPEDFGISDGFEEEQRTPEEILSEPLRDVHGNEWTEEPNMARGRRRNMAGGLKPIDIAKKGTKFAVYVEGSSPMLDASAVRKLGFSDTRPIVKRSDGKLDFGVSYSDKPALMTKKEAKDLAHMIGRYKLNLGDLVYTYTSGY